MTLSDYVRDAAVTWFLGFFPLFEIYIAVPAGIALGLGTASAVFWSVFGNYTPVLLIEFGYERLMRIERVRSWLEKRRSERFERSVNRYGPWFVLLITPWTGVWVLAVTAKVLGMRRRALLGYSFASILAYAVILGLAADNLIDEGVWSNGSLGFNFDASQIVVILLTVYAFTYGKRHLKRLSDWLKQPGSSGTRGSSFGTTSGDAANGDPGRANPEDTFLAHDSSSPQGDAEEEGRAEGREPDYDWNRARRERVWLYRHAAVFVAAHVLFFAFDWATASVPLAALVDSWREGGMVGTLPFHNAIFADGSSVWSKVLVIHAIVAFSYTVFPKRKKQGA